EGLLVPGQAGDRGVRHRPVVGHVQAQRQPAGDLLWHPGKDADAHRREVETFTDDKEDLERELAARLKIAAPQPRQKLPEPQELPDRLPEGAVCLDLVRFVHFTLDPNNPGKPGEKQTPRYVAFVLTKGKPVVRVEIDATAEEIDKALTVWRRSIVANRADER